MIETPLPVISGLPRDAAERLFAENTALVGAVLKRFQGMPPQEREDAEALARLGLWHAARRFDPALGFAFSTFATASIWGFIMRALDRERLQTRVPCVSLNAPLRHGEGDADERAELLPDPCDRYALLLDADAFEARLTRLSPREHRLVRAVFAEGLTYAEAAEGEGITRQRAAQMVKTALRRLRYWEEQRQPYPSQE